MAAQFGNVSELWALASRPGVAGGQVSGLYALVSTGAPPSRYEQVSELVALASVQQDFTMAEVSEIVALVSYVSQEAERFNSRAWYFELDQHQFYVLHLGMRGTIVYDILTGQWAEWQTEGYSGWNAENGIMWNGDVYFGDNSGPTLWRLDPHSFLDEDFKLIKRVVTGGIPVEGRDTIRSGMFVLSATREGDVDVESTPYVELLISDDGGFTFRSKGAIEINPDKVVQDFSWRSLGTIKAPGRVFMVEDSGGFVTIKGANQKVDGEEDA